MDFNSYTPNIRHKIHAGYTFCSSCAERVERHLLGEALFAICGALKMNAATIKQPKASEYEGGVKVFLCYAGPDRERVMSLYGRLLNDGFKPWMDKTDLIPGQDWRLGIRCAIESADYFVPCISAHFQHRTYGLKEVKLALEVLDTMPEGTIYLVPARLEECRIEDRLANRQWVDLFESDGYEKLVRALRWSET